MVLVVISLIVGLLIGAVGIGGVLLVPSLSLIADIGVHEAIPACMLSYLATGAVGILVYTRHGSIQWSLVGWLCLGAIPAAYLGSISLAFMSANLVMSIIVVLMVFVGIDVLVKSFRKSEGEKEQKVPGAITLVLIGGVTGFGSAITGTGGPLIIVPIILYLGLPVLTAVGLSQAIQIPIASFASIGNWSAGTINLELSMTIAAAMIVGSLVGGTAVHRLPKEPIRKFVASLLIIAGSGIGIKLVLQLINS